MKIIETVKSIDDRYDIHIVDEKPCKLWHLWHVRQEEILPGYDIYVTLDPDREYDWMMSIDVNRIFAVKK